MPNWLMLSFQDTASASMEHILFFHDHTMIVLILITILTLHLLLSLLNMKNFNKNMHEGQDIETIWTVLPALLLIFIAFPSLKTLYLMEDTKSPLLSLKTTGHQWYWSYEYPNLASYEEDTFMNTTNSLRLMKTSELIHMPINSTSRVMVTSADVIHSWTIPSLGVKVDALPGRLNQLFITPKRMGLLTGQCSEICGTNHSFMPILMKISTAKEFIKKMEKSL